MHIQEGVLPLAVLGAGAAVAVGGVAFGLRRMKEDDTVKVAVMSSAFFVASLIHVPFGPAAVHLVMNGLMGVILGWAAVPAIAVALALQFLLFGHGGLTTLGVNTVVMALPAVACYLAFSRAIQRSGQRRATVLGACTGCLGLGLAALLLAGFLLSAGADFAAVAGATLVGHVPVFIVEGIVTAAAIGFLHRVRPETFALAVHHANSVNHAEQPVGEIDEAIR